MVYCWARAAERQNRPKHTTSERPRIFMAIYSVNARAPPPVTEMSVGRRKRLPHNNASPCPPTWDRRFRLSTPAEERDEAPISAGSVSYTHLRAHETDSYLVCRL